MVAAIGLREDYDADGLRGLARLSKDAKQSRRLLSLAVIYDGGRRREAARTGDVSLKVIRDWVLRFNTLGPEGLNDRKAPGGTPKLNDAQRQALAKRVDAGPDPARDGAALGPARPMTSAPSRPTSSAPSVPSAVPALLSCSHAATPPPCSATWKRSPPRSTSVPTPSCSSIRLAGTRPTS